MQKWMLIFVFNCWLLGGYSQTAKPVYHPCFLMDSIDKNLEFIKRNTQKIFIDTFDCRQTLLDSVAIHYTHSKNKKYLEALNYIRVYGDSKVEDLYTDIIKRFCESDFSGFLNELYLSKGLLQALEKELIATMNMIIDGRSLKQKYMGQLNVEIAKAKDKKDNTKVYYLEKLKVKIEEERF
ncbi:MAG: hypothetical protein IPH78_05385 [Bacteroidetes bacterium]|nr:hypothetical protein [Bacteroidota bacterium]MBK8658242.1 hypothetical protein [Bacteroidota bacterium]